MKRLLLGLIAAGVLAAQPPAPELVIVAVRTAAVCQEISALIPAYVTCKPLVAAEGVNLPAGSAVRFTFNYTDPSGKPQTATATVDANHSGAAQWLYFPPTDFSAPNVSAVLLLASGPVALKQ